MKLVLIGVITGLVSMMAAVSVQAGPTLSVSTLVLVKVHTAFQVDLLAFDKVLVAGLSQLAPR